MAEHIMTTTGGELNRVSALAGSYQSGQYGVVSSDGAGIQFTELGLSCLTQYSAWAETSSQLLEKLRRAAAADSLPGRSGSVRGARGSVLQIEPLKWWLLDAQAIELDVDVGVVLDLSHARTRLRVEGRCAGQLLNRHLALDLRDAAAKVGTVQACALHQAPVMLLHTAEGFELFISRAYAHSVFELLRKSAEQFGFEIKPFASV